MNYVVCSIDDRGVATVTLNNPEKHNAFDDVIIAELTQAFEKMDADPAVKVMVLAAEGKHFSAGADLGWMKRMASYTHEENLRDARALATMLKTLNFLSKPTIARVQGSSFGGAVGLVSCCDMVVASPRALFCLSEVKIGLIPATISPYVIDAIGQRAARRYFVTAEAFNVDKAFTLGLVSEVVEEDQLDERINALIEKILTCSPQAIESAKSLVMDFAKQPLTDAIIEDSCNRIADIRVSAEGQEGLNAFLEKRQPSWIK